MLHEYPPKCRDNKLKVSLPAAIMSLSILLYSQTVFSNSLLEPEVSIYEVTTIENSLTDNNLETTAENINANASYDNLNSNIVDYQETHIAPIGKYSSIEDSVRYTEVGDKSKNNDINTIDNLNSEETNSTEQSLVNASLKASPYGQKDLNSFSFQIHSIPHQLLDAIQRFTWDFGDGTNVTTTQAQEVIHAFTDEGQYQVTANLHGTADEILAKFDTTVMVKNSAPSIIRNIEPRKISGNHQTPDIDGILDEEIWKMASVIPYLSFFPDDVPALENTKVRLLVDESNLYISFENTASALDATQTIRDSNMNGDDRVMFELEPFNSSALASRFIVNALGTQRDTIMGGRASNIKWKGDWIASTKRTPQGWSTEMAIPLEILNFRATTTKFGANFKRYHKSPGKWSSWIGQKENDDYTREGNLVGLSLSSVRKSKTLTALPYLISGKNGVDIRNDPVNDFIQGGVTVRYEPDQNLTVIADILPDHSQLETEFESIDFSYTERTLDEVRPFFQEGAAYFNTSKHYFYSRRIPNVYSGFKSFTHLQNGSLGGFITSSPNNRVDTMLRFTNRFATDHELELVGVSHRENGNSNLVFGSSIKGNWNIDTYYKLNYSYSDTRSETRKHGSYAQLEIGNSYGQFDSKVDVALYDKSYQPENGLVDKNLPGTKGVALSLSYSQTERDSFFTSFHANSTIETRKAFSGQLQNNNAYLDASFTTSNQVTVTGSLFRSDYSPNSGTPGDFSEVINKDHYLSLSADYLSENNRFGHGLYFADGQLGGGEYRYTTAYSWVQPVQPLYLSLSVGELVSFGHTDQLTLDAKLNLSENSSVSAQFYKQTGLDQARLLYKRIVRSGIDIFCLYKKTTNEPTEISLKLVWTI